MSVQKRITFTDGASGAVVSGAVVRGEQDIWWIRGRSGQRLRVQAMSDDANVAFDLFDMSTHPQNALTVEGSDCDEWEGDFPCNGDVMIRVGAKRGVCAYQLSVSITSDPGT